MLQKGLCLKQSHVNGFIGWNYENAVSRQQIREGGEGTFQVKPRKWGERVVGTPLVEHKGNTYLELKVEKVVKTDYFQVDDGKITPCQKGDIAHLMRKPSPNGGHQGVTKEIILRDYDLSNIVELRIGGVVYQID